MPETAITKEEIQPIVLNILNRYRSRANIYNLIAERLDFQTQTNAQLTANQNNYEIGNGTHFRISSDAARTITGFTGGVSGKVLALSNNGSNIITLANQNASSGAANRILTGIATDYNINADETIFLIYDDTTARWRLIGSTLKVAVTITPVGTTGNQTINKIAGRVNIAAAGTTVTVTNSLVTADSIVLAVAATNDTTARVTNVVPSAGSFVINTVATTSECAFNFLVIS